MDPTINRVRAEETETRRVGAESTIEQRPEEGRNGKKGAVITKDHHTKWVDRNEDDENRGGKGEEERVNQ
jgi:hypothetical protein